MTLMHPFMAGAVPADCDLTTGKCTAISEDQIQQQEQTQPQAKAADEELDLWAIGYKMTIGILILGLLLGSFFTVPQQSMVIVERLGKFSRVAKPGLNFKIPLLDQRAGMIDLRVLQLDLKA